MLDHYLLRYPQFCASLCLLHVRIVQIISAYSETILVISKKISSLGIWRICIIAIKGEKLSTSQLIMVHHEKNCSFFFFVYQMGCIKSKTLSCYCPLNARLKNGFCPTLGRVKELQFVNQLFRKVATSFSSLIPLMRGFFMKIGKPSNKTRICSHMQYANIHLLRYFRSTVIQFGNNFSFENAFFYHMYFLCN